MLPKPDSTVAKPVAAEILAQGLAEAAQALLRAANAILGAAGQSLVSHGFTGTLPVADPRAGIGAAGSRVNFDARTVREAINEFLTAKARANISDRYLRTLRLSLINFSRGRANDFLHEVTPQDCEKWIYGLRVRPRTMKGYLSDVRTMFHWCQRRRYCLECPADAVELPASDTKAVAPCIHTPAEVQTVLDSLRASDLDVMRHIAVRYFAGVRSAEAHRLSEENLKLDQGLIEVPAAKAKTRSRRLVTIQPNLRAWLDLGGELRNLCPENVRQKIRLSGVEWKHNATRHSFVSYHYAAFGDAKKTAREAGHTEEMLFANYRALVTEEAGKAYFAIYPKKL